MIITFRIPVIYLIFESRFN